MPFSPLCIVTERIAAHRMTVPPGGTKRHDLEPRLGDGKTVGGSVPSAIVSDASAPAPWGMTKGWLIAVAHTGCANVCADGDSAAIVTVKDVVSEVGW